MKGGGFPWLESRPGIFRKKTRLGLIKRMMTVTLKLLLSAATFCFALGYASRHGIDRGDRGNLTHRKWMMCGLALAWTVPIAWGTGALLGVRIRPGYWLIDLLGGEGRAHLLAGFQQGMTLLALLVLGFQGWLGLRRAALHRTLARGVILLWLCSYVTGMFFYF